MLQFQNISLLTDHQLSTLEMVPVDSENLNIKFSDILFLEFQSGVPGEKKGEVEQSWDGRDLSSEVKVKHDFLCVLFCFQMLVFTKSDTSNRKGLSALKNMVISCIPDNWKVGTSQGSVIQLHSMKNVKLRANPKVKLQRDKCYTNKMVHRLREKNPGQWLTVTLFELMNTILCIVQ